MKKRNVTRGKKIHFERGSHPLCNSKIYLSYYAWFQFFKLKSTKRKERVTCKNCLGGIARGKHHKEKQKTFEAPGGYRNGSPYGNY